MPRERSIQIAILFAMFLLVFAGCNGRRRSFQMFMYSGEKRSASIHFDGETDAIDFVVLYPSAALSQGQSLDIDRSSFDFGASYDGGSLSFAGPLGAWYWVDRGKLPEEILAGNPKPDLDTMKSHANEIVKATSAAEAERILGNLVPK